MYIVSSKTTEEFIVEKSLPLTAVFHHLKLWVYFSPLNAFITHTQ
jgi:hypothetical protein